jgi:hypothetical protein
MAASPAPTIATWAGKSKQLLGAGGDRYGGEVRGHNEHGLG